MGRPVSWVAVGWKFGAGRLDKCAGYRSYPAAPQNNPNPYSFHLQGTMSAPWALLQNTNNPEAGPTGESAFVHF